MFGRAERSCRTAGIMGVGDFRFGKAENRLLGGLSLLGLDRTAGYSTQRPI